MCRLLVRCLRCRGRPDDDGDNDNVHRGDDSSEDSEIYMMRRRREARKLEKSRQRDEFLENAVRKQKIVMLKRKHDSSSGNHHCTSEDEVCITEQDAGGGGTMSCAICLIDYEEGDWVSSSHNRSCQHVFHRDCILAWLKSHDACPCCRQDFLAFSDDDDNGVGDGNGGDGEQDGVETAPSPIGTSADGDEVIRNIQLDRLYGMDDLENSTASIRWEPDEVATIPEPWDTRLERNLERLRLQVDERAQAARNQINQIRERRENRLRGRNREENEAENDHSDDDEEGRLEQSIQLVRSQFARLREVANREIQNRRNNHHPRDTNAVNSRRTSTSSSRFAVTHRGAEDRLEDAMQVVRSRLEDIANSGAANRLRERSSRTVQQLMKQASKLRR